MMREDVLAAVTGTHCDMLELKGYDLFIYDTTTLGISSYWQLMIRYDETGRVMTAEAQYFHRDCGLFSTNFKSVL